ncbi:MAG: hypothetical protein GEV03_16255 [Streptosporangiales bacterium]|nr:hypothetical protein [Streptosporangiales bacterium]
MADVPRDPDRPDEPDRRGDMPPHGRDEDRWDPVVSADGRTLSGFELPEYDMDRDLGDGTTSRDWLGRFTPDRANLPEVSLDEARDHIAEYADERPWLAPARDREPEVQRVFTALDVGQGHALERHDGYPTEPMVERRATFLEDPAQLDEAKRERSEDAFHPGRTHRCGEYATRIWEPDAFATAFARGIEHPDVRRALDRPFDPDRRPPDVAIPVVDLLGPDGHRFCAGYRLEPVGGSAEAAVDCRAHWVDAQRRGQEPDAPEPKAAPIDSFEGGRIAFFFRPTRSRDGYEVATMYVEPPDQPRKGA